MISYRQDIHQGPAMPTPTAPTLSLRKRRGNPIGNPGLNLSPRCGARTRSGCPCRGPAVHGGLRCRMHGGHSTGPRTAAGLARSRTARLTHGGYSEAARAQARYRITLLRRSGVFLEVVRCLKWLPAALASRVLEAPELASPPPPTGGLSEKADRELRRQEAAALLPWREAVKAARGRQLLGKKGEPHVPVSSGLLPLPLSPAREGRGDIGAVAEDEPHAPVFVRAGGVVGWEKKDAAPTLTTEGGAPLRLAPARAGRGDAGAAAGDEPRAPVFLGAKTRRRVEELHVPVRGAVRPCASACARGSSLPGSRPEVAPARHDPAPGKTGGVAGRDVDRPHAPVSGPPPGLTRKERKRWKWEQRKARKAGGPCS